MPAIHLVSLTDAVMPRAARLPRTAAPAAAAAAAAPLIRAPMVIWDCGRWGLSRSRAAAEKRKL